MSDQQKIDFEICEEKSIKNTYLYIRNIKINEESYETKVLNENNIDMLFRQQMTYEGEKRALRYDVSNTICFDEYLKNKKLSKQNVCDVVHMIDSALNSMENYLLSENSLSLNMRLIRVTKTIGDRFVMKFVAIPNNQADFSYELSKFLIRILRFVDTEDKNALSLAYGLFVKSSKDNYTISDLLELVDQSSGTDKSYLSLIDPDSQMRYDEGIVEDNIDVISEDKNAEYDLQFFDADIKETQTYIEPMKAEIHSDGLSITMDVDTKGKIDNSGFFDNFDDEVDTNVEMQNKKKLHKTFFAKTKALSAHITPNLCKLVIAPILLLLIPSIFIMLYGASSFMQYLPIITIYELVIAFIYIVNLFLTSSKKIGV